MEPVGVVEVFTVRRTEDEGERVMLGNASPFKVFEEQIDQSLRYCKGSPTGGRLGRSWNRPASGTAGDLLGDQDG